MIQRQADRETGEESARYAAGKNVLICWHHGEIPNLLRTLGANPDTLLPKGRWPDRIFDWVIQLSYDHDGKVIPAERGG